MQNLQLLSALIAKRNAISAEISAVIGRPAQLGHLGEFIASVLFDITLEASANNKGFDGRFAFGSLAGKTVDIKTYAKREGIIDLRTRDLPDFYLVLTGPIAPAASSKGQDRPWLLAGIYLFDAPTLVDSLLSRGTKVGVAASVAKCYWDKAEIFPKQSCKLIELKPEHRAWLDSFASPPE